MTRRRAVKGVIRSLTGVRNRRLMVRVFVVGASPPVRQHPAADRLNPVIDVVGDAKGSRPGDMLVPPDADRR